MHVSITYDNSTQFIEKLEESHPEKFLILQEIDYNITVLNEFIHFYDYDVFTFDPFEFKRIYGQKFSFKNLQWKI